MHLFRNSLLPLRILLPLGLSLVGFGCSTSYEAYTGKVGYTETILGSNTYTVSFISNGSTTSQRTRDFALLRAAELTVHHGYAYLAIMEQNDSVETHQYPGAWVVDSPLSSSTRASTGPSRIPAQSHPAEISDSVGPGSAAVIKEHGASLTVFASPAPPHGFPTYYEAGNLIKELKAKYRLS